MTAQIGSVFLGDVQRHRILSPTPPSSPDPIPTKKFAPAKQSLMSQKPPTITPQLSLELRLRWLEALLYGVKPRDKPPEKGETPLLRNAQQIQKRLDDLVQNNDSLRKFMDQYDQYAHLLTLSGIIPNALPSYESMTPSEFETFLQEMEPDIRAADRDMREIEALDQKGVATVGKLTTPQIIKHSVPGSKRSSKLTSKTSSSLHPWSNVLGLWSSGMERMSAHCLSYSSSGTTRFAKLGTRWPSWNATRLSDAN